MIFTRTNRFRCHVKQFEFDSMKQKDMVHFEWFVSYKEVWRIYTSINGVMMNQFIIHFFNRLKIYINRFTLYFYKFHSQSVSKPSTYKYNFLSSFLITKIINYFPLYSFSLKKICKNNFFKILCDIVSLIKGIL